MFDRKRILAVFIILVLAAASWFSARSLLHADSAIHAFFSGMPVWLAGALFVVTYVLSSFILVDLKDILKIVAALVFGAYVSTVLIWMAEMINCGMLFGLARRFGRAWVQRRFGLGERDIGWIRRVCATGPVFALRLVPVLPYRILDIAYGLTAIDFRRYFLISAVASPVRIYWLQFIMAGVGSAITDQATVKAYFLQHPEFVRFSLIYIVISIIAAVMISRRYR